MKLDASFYEDTASIEYITRWCREVYLPSTIRGRRSFDTTPQLRDWILMNIGPRPSLDYHLFLTGNHDEPAEWRVVDAFLARRIYRVLTQE